MHRYIGCELVSANRIRKSAKPLPKLVVLLPPSVTSIHYAGLALFKVSSQLFALAESGRKFQLLRPTLRLCSPYGRELSSLSHSLIFQTIMSGMLRSEHMQPLHFCHSGLDGLIAWNWKTTALYRLEGK